MLSADHWLSSLRADHRQSAVCVDKCTVPRTLRSFPRHALERRVGVGPGGLLLTIFFILMHPWASRCLGVMETCAAQRHRRSPVGLQSFDVLVAVPTMYHMLNKDLGFGVDWSPSGIHFEPAQLNAE